MKRGRNLFNPGQDSGAGFKVSAVMPAPTIELREAGWKLKLDDAGA